MDSRFLKHAWKHLLGLTILIATATLPMLSQQVEFKNTWGTFVAPVYNTSESGAYAGAELFAGPNKFGSYFAGVLPNGTKVTPAGVVAQIGMNPLGAVLTPDGRYLITSNDDEREDAFLSFQSPINLGGYTLTVFDTTSMNVVSQINEVGKFFVGMQATGAGPYTVWVSGGGDNDVKLFALSAAGVLSSNGHIVIAPVTSSTSGYVSNYTPDPYFNTVQKNGFKPPVPSGFNRTAAAQTTFPAGSALSPDGKYLYVACDGDNSVAVIDTTLGRVVQHVVVGYFPYAVSVSQDGTKVLVSNWGVTEYKFAHPGYGADGKLNSLPAIPNNEVDGYYVPVTSTTGSNPKTSSVSILSAPGGDGSQLSLLGSVYQGHPLDDLYVIGDTHPSATAIVRGGGRELLYVTKSNSDAVAIMDLQGNKIANVELPLITAPTVLTKAAHGTYPNALAVSPDNTRVYVAEAGINSVAVLDTHNPAQPVLIGRIPTDWYPTGLVLSADGNSLYVLNAKGVGEDINPNTNTSQGTPPPTGIISTPITDSNYIFGSLQKIDVPSLHLDVTTVAKNNYAVMPGVPDTSVVPIGGTPSPKIKHVVFILQENKTFDSKLGNLGGHFGVFSSLTYNNADGSPYWNGQYTGVTLNYQALAQNFAAAVNYYSDSEESDAGHQFSASGTATDYTEKTLLVKTGRGLLVNKNFEPEDYPESGYIFNNAARNGVSFKEYGVFAARIEGTDTGTSGPTTLSDPQSGNCGAPELNPDNFHITNPLVNLGDVTSPVQGLGQSFFMKLPGLAIMGENNANGEPHLDHNYPGYNFNISDQRRAQKFIADFDRMVAAGTLPQFIYLYLPNEHTGSVQCPNSAQVYGSASNVQQVADGDVAVGMVVQHLMQSPVYYDAQSDTGMAIFMSPDDAQSTLDHIHPHRSPLVLISPFAKPGYYSTRHYITASVVKTEELLLGLPPNNLGDMLATDLRDLFQSRYNQITPDKLKFKLKADYVPSDEGKKIWSLVSKLDTSAPDRDSHRLGALGRLSMAADDLHESAAKKNHLNSADYKKQQAELYGVALKLVNAPKPKDNDD
jgi:YVTN family beta-propeller protein